MAIAFDNALTQQVAVGSTTLTYSYTCTGANGMLVVNVGNNTGDLVTGTTYNGVAMTLAGKHAPVSGSATWQYMFYLKGPATGANNVVVTCSGSSTITGTTSSYTGAGQTGGVDFAFQESSTPGGGGDDSITVTVSVANSWLVAREVPTLLEPVSVLNGVSRASFIEWVDSNGAVATGSQTIGWHWNGADTHGISVIAFGPPVASGPTNVKTWDAVTQSTGIKTYEAVALASTKSVIGVT